MSRSTAASVCTSPSCSRVRPRWERVSMLLSTGPTVVMPIRVTRARVFSGQSPARRSKKGMSASTTVPATGIQRANQSRTSQRTATCAPPKRATYAMGLGRRRVRRLGTALYPVDPGEQPLKSPADHGRAAERADGGHVHQNRGTAVGTELRDRAGGFSGGDARRPLKHPVLCPVVLLPVPAHDGATGVQVEVGREGAHAYGDRVELRVAPRPHHQRVGQGQTLQLVSQAAAPVLLDLGALLLPDDGRHHALTEGRLEPGPRFKDGEEHALDGGLEGSLNEPGVAGFDGAETGGLAVPAREFYRGRIGSRKSLTEPASGRDVEAMRVDRRGGRRGRVGPVDGQHRPLM